MRKICLPYVTVVHPSVPPHGQRGRTQPSFCHVAWPTDRPVTAPLSCLSRRKINIFSLTKPAKHGPRRWDSSKLTAGFGRTRHPRPHHPVSRALWLRRISFSSVTTGRDIRTCRTATARGAGRTKRWPGELSSQVHTACRPDSTRQRAGVPLPRIPSACFVPHARFQLLARARFLKGKQLHPARPYRAPASLPRAKPGYLVAGSLGLWFFLLGSWPVEKHRV
jgi:hypothetical protein